MPATLLLSYETSFHGKSFASREILIPLGGGISETDLSLIPCLHMASKELSESIGTALSSIPEGKHVRRVRLFGSRLRGDHRPDSDYDFVVDLDATLSLLDLIGIQLALEKALHAKVDLFMPQNVHPVIRKKVLSTAQCVYEG